MCLSHVLTLSINLISFLFTFLKGHMLLYSCYIYLGVIFTYNYSSLGPCYARQCARDLIYILHFLMRILKVIINHFPVGKKQNFEIFLYVHTLFHWLLNHPIITFYWFIFQIILYLHPILSISSSLSTTLPLK